MAVETIGEAYSLGWRVRARCVHSREDGAHSKSSRECIYRKELDIETLVWTRGRDFPLSRLESRLRCEINAQVDSPKRSVDEAVTALIRENPDVQAAFTAMRVRGVANEECRAEIGRAFLGCMWEAWNGMPYRFAAVFDGLKRGRTAAELFPDKLYE